MNQVGCILRICSLILLCVISWLAQAAPNVVNNTELPNRVVTALQKAKIPPANVAVYVQSLDDISPVITYNAQQPFNPASVMKLVTTNAALELLGPAYRWRTEVYRDGELHHGVLNGNIIIKGFGDPSFNEAEMRRMLVSLQQAGVKAIYGNLVIDKTYFDANLVGMGAVAKGAFAKVAFDGEIYRAYNAMPSALLVNARATSFKFNSDGGLANVVQEVELPQITVNNQLKLVTFDCEQWSSDWRSQLAYVVKAKAHATAITFTGNYAADCGDKYLELSLFDDTQYAYFLFIKLWKELGGIYIEPSLSEARTQAINLAENSGLKLQTVMPATAIKLLSQESKPLSEVIRDINKYSNNLMARQLLLTIAAEKTGLPATEALGEQVLRAWFLSKHMNNINAAADLGEHIQDSELIIENGSGLSRKERISAQHLGELLVGAYHGANMPEFMASLPILGVDGTLIKRLKASPLSGKAYLKTGSLSGVSSIAGYILDNKNRRWAVVFLVNHTQAASAKEAQNNLLEWIYSQP